MRIVASLAATAVLAIAMPAIAETTTHAKEQCDEREPGRLHGGMDQARRVERRGSVSQSQAQGVVTDFKAADTNKDGKLTQTEFMAACDKGLVSGICRKRQRRPRHERQRAHFTEEVAHAGVTLLAKGGDAWVRERVPLPLRRLASP